MAIKCFTHVNCIQSQVICGTSVFIWENMHNLMFSLEFDFSMNNVRIWHTSKISRVLIHFFRIKNCSKNSNESSFWSYFYYRVFTSIFHILNGFKPLNYISRAISVRYGICLENIRLDSRKCFGVVHSNCPY